MSFEYTLPNDFKKTDYILFAFVHPFTLTDIQLSVANFEAKCIAQKGVYFHKEVLCHSLEGLPMELITVTWDPQDCSNLQAIVDLQKSLQPVK